MILTINRDRTIRILIICLAILLADSLMGTGNVYADEPSTWAREEIQEANRLKATTEGLSSEYQASLTRAEFVELLVKTYESVTGEVIDISTIKNPFKDTNKIYLLKAYAIGIVSGTSSTTFSPDQLVTREQMVVMLIRMIQGVEIKLSVVILEDSMISEFSDHEAIASWAESSVAKAVANKIVSGVGENKFSPKGYSSKEQAVVVNYRLLMRMTSEVGIDTTWQDNLANYEADVETVLSLDFGEYEDSEQKAFVTTTTLNMRKEPDTSNEANIFRKLKAFEEVVIIEPAGEWYKVVATGEEVGYVHSDYIHPYSPDDSLDDLRAQIVTYAKQFLGTPYDYANDDLYNGTDCTGLTGQVMRPFGYVLSRSSVGQGSDGVPISREMLLPGDLITYGYSGNISHVAMYVGDDQIIHATVRKGVIVTAMEGYLYKPIISYRRVIF